MKTTREHLAAVEAVKPLAEKIALALLEEAKFHRALNGAHERVDSLRREYEQVAAGPGMKYPAGAAVVAAIQTVGDGQIPPWVR